MISANLACSLANAKRRVVLIDADLRLPVQQKMFGIDSKLGLTSVLNGECTLNEALVETHVKGLYLLPSGPRPNNPAEALQMPEFQQLIDDLRPDFDMVLLDTPPLLAVTDASNVAGHVDGVIVVFRIVRNIKPLSKRALTILRSLHTNVVGLIINAVGDSSYSACYARAWSEKYGGRPGSEFGQGYRRYGSDKYLEATSESSTTVCGRDALSNSSKCLEQLAAK
jgi:capsular exopolysaccharide synthesis family protein